MAEGKTNENPGNSDEATEFTAMTLNMGIKGKKDERKNLLLKIIKLGKRPSVICLQESRGYDSEYKGYGAAKVESAKDLYVAVMWDEQVFTEARVIDNTTLYNCLEEDEKVFLKQERFKAVILKNKHCEVLAVSWHGPTKETETKKLQKEVINCINESLEETKKGTFPYDFEKKMKDLYKKFPQDCKLTKPETLVQPIQQGLDLEVEQITDELENLGLREGSNDKVCETTNQTQMDDWQKKTIQKLEGLKQVLDDTDFPNLKKQNRKKNRDVLLKALLATKVEHVLVGGDFNLVAENVSVGPTPEEKFIFTNCGASYGRFGEEFIDYFMYRERSADIVKAPYTLTLVKDKLQWTKPTEKRRIHELTSKEYAEIENVVDRHDPVFVRIEIPAKKETS